MIVKYKALKLTKPCKLATCHVFYFLCFFFSFFVFLSAEIALAFALHARAGDETQGDLTDVATAPRGECLSRRQGGLGDFFKKKNSLVLFLHH